MGFYDESRHHERSWLELSAKWSTRNVQDCRICLAKSLSAIAVAQFTNTLHLWTCQLSPSS